MTFLICNIAIYADDTRWGYTSDLWQLLELASELESDLWDTVECGRKWLVDFNTGKTQLVLFDWYKNSAAIDVKMNGSVIEEQLAFKICGLLFLSNWIGALTLSLLLKLLPRKLELWFILRSLFLLSSHCISINLPYGTAWNTVVISGLVLVATWNCWTSYQNEYVGLLVIHLLSHMNPWPIVEM